tara:strand:- start:2614 stop:4128 length:1515 start_codon:yes stop_codon:yes gene_type:complete
MAINFPNSPTNGSTYTYQGVTYTWIATSGGGATGYWKINTPGTLGPATGPVLDGGTNNALYATAKALEDSKYVKEDIDEITRLTHGGTNRVITASNGVTLVGTATANIFAGDQMFQSGVPGSGGKLGQRWDSNGTTNYWQAVDVSNANAVNIMAYTRATGVSVFPGIVLTDIAQPSNANSFTRKDYVDGRDNTITANANTYADTQDASHSTADRAYTDSRIIDANAYADAQDVIHSTADKAYADAQVATRVPSAGVAVKTDKLVIERDNSSSYTVSNLELKSNAGDVFLGFHASGATATALVHVRGSTGLRIVGNGGSANYSDLSMRGLTCGRINVTAGFGGEVGDLTVERDIQCDRNGRFEGILAYGTLTPISDRRAKKDIVDAVSEWNFLDDVEFKNYQLYKDLYDMDAGGVDAPLKVGVIADEMLENESTSALVVQHDEEMEFSMGADGNPIKAPKTVNYQEMYTKGLVVLKEAKQRIESLEEYSNEMEDRLSALEKAILG